MNKPGKLYLIGTPIGNLNDITLRAVATLRQVHYIACEDTRVSQKLLNHFSLGSKRLISYHNFNEPRATQLVLNLLENGHDVALLSDAGMPAIADPGAGLINQLNSRGLELELIPGVSALTSAFALSGFGPEFTFLGFGKPSRAQLEAQIRSLQPGHYVLFVAPHKLQVLLALIATHWPDQHQLFLAKELTKLHQRFFWGRSAEIQKQLGPTPRGEFTLCLKIIRPKAVKVNKYPPRAKRPDQPM